MLCRPDDDKKEMAIRVASRLQFQDSEKIPMANVSIDIYPQPIKGPESACDITNLYLDVINEFANQFIASENAINRKHSLKANMWPVLSSLLSLTTVGLTAFFSYESVFYHEQHKSPCEYSGNITNISNTTIDESGICDKEDGFTAGAVVTGIVLGIGSIASMVASVMYCCKQLGQYPTALPPNAKDNYNALATMVNVCFLDSQESAKVKLQETYFSTREEYYEALLELKDAIKQAHKNFSSKHSSTEQPHGRFFSVRGRMNDEKMIEIANAILSPEKQGKENRKSHK